MLRDIHHALRTLSRQRATHAVVLLVVATALGAATAIFSLVDAALLRPLPYPEPRRLLEIRERPLDAAEGSGRVLAGHLADLSASRTLSDVAAILSTGMSVTSLPEPMNSLMRRSSANYFRLLGVEPLFGRTFRPEEDRPGGPRVVILSYELWQSHLGGDAGVLGRSLGLDGEPYEIVGILPPGFRDPLFTGRPALWLPLALTEDEQARTGPRPRRLTAVFARLADGVSLEAARAEVEQIGTGLERRYEAAAGHVTTVRSLHEVVVEGYRPALVMLFGAVLLVLVVAFSNLAHLLLARALGRRRELALRLALGATWRQLARQLLAESLLLALGACGLGLLLAAAGLGPLLALLPEGFGVPRLESVGIDARAVAFAFVVALVFGLGFGLLPLRATPRRRLGDALSARTGGGLDARAPRRARQLLVVGEIALSLALLVSAGWLALTFWHLTRSSPGFEPRGVLTLRTSARGAEYGSPERWPDFYEQVTRRLEALPGVETVGGVQRLSLSLPWQGTPTGVPGRETAPGAEPRAMVFTVTPGFFAATGTTLLSGRGFTRDDDGDAPPVVILSRTAARLLFGDGETAGGAVGRTVVVEAGGGLPRRVVGLVGDVRHGEAPGPRPAVYLPHRQNPMPTLTLAVRSSLADPASLAGELQRTVWAISPDSPIYDLAPLAALLRDLDWRPRLLMQLLGGFAALALLLSSSGLYAVLSYVVAGDRRELGIRMALGARRSQVRARVLKQALGLLALGLLAGLPLTFAAGRLLGHQLFGVSTHDPLVPVVISALLAGVTLLASYVPARRASRTDPATVLREE